MNTTINRREALRKSMMMVGAAVATPSIIAFLESCSSKPQIDYTPVFFNKDQIILLTVAGDIILPKTNTPSASEVGVPAFIDKMVNECYKDEDQKSFVDGLKEFDEGAEQMLGKKFIDLNEEKQKQYVLMIHETAVNLVKKHGDAPRPFVLKLKEIVMLGYFTSEPGATQVLQYNQVPGYYKGCIPLTEAGNGKTWA